MALFQPKVHKFIGSLLLFLINAIQISETGAQSVGVCNGRLGNNLPTDQEVVNLYKSNGIGKMRIYDPNQPTLEALQGSNIELTLGVPNQDLQSLSDPSAASKWVQTNILDFSPGVNFKYISVGNEIKASDSASQFVLPAMKNIHDSIVSAGLDIKVSTSIEPSLLGTSYPPSAGSFSTSSASYITPIIDFLVQNKSPLLVNVYPYFGYINDPEQIGIDYALLSSTKTVVQDNQLGYQNLFDAILDSVYSALEKAGGSVLQIVVSETGWPSAGGTASTVDYAGTYYKNVIEHVKNGTPKRPGQPIETYLFAMFDENQKGPAETERNFGLFSPDEKPKYQLSF